MVEALADITECPVCFLTYVNPRILPCHHSLCAQCVSQIQRGATIKCPMCNTTQQVDKVLTDFRMTQILDALKGKTPEASQSAGFVKCKLCRKEPVAFHCTECNEWQCEACKTLHRRSKVSKSHHVIPVAIKCQEVKDKVAQETADIAQRTDKQTQFIALIDAAMTQVKTQGASALQESEELRERSVREVTKHFDCIDASISDFIQTQMKSLETIKQHLTQLYQEINSKRDTLERLVRESAAELAVNGATILRDIKQLSGTTRCRDLHIGDIGMRLVKERACIATSAARLQLNGQIKHEKICKDCGNNCNVWQPFCSLCGFAFQ